MNRDEISWVRQMLRDYYDKMLARAEELEEEMPLYTDITMPSLLFGDTHIRILSGSEYRPPISIRDEIKHLKRELKNWSVVHDDSEDEV